MRNHKEHGSGVNDNSSGDLDNTITFEEIKRKGEEICPEGKLQKHKKQNTTKQNTPRKPPGQSNHISSYLSSSKSEQDNKQHS